MKALKPAADPLSTSSDDRLEPMPSSLRLEMQQVLHRDLSGVRVHQGFGHGNAALAAKASGAKAYTQGQDIYFRPGTYHPHSKQGRELVMHELQHVAQQGHPGGTAVATTGRVPSPGASGLSID